MQSLHHAHIRSPKRLPIRPEALNERYYQSVRRLVLGPTSIAPKAVVHKFSFRLSPKDRDRLTPVETDPDELLPIQRDTNGTLRVRIRCCYLLDHQQHSITDGDWVTKDVVWPEHIFLEVNQSVLTLRRKAHHSKDLPVEVPAKALLEENHLHVWIPETAARAKEAPKNSHPYIAVELVETLSHSAILSLVKIHSIQQSSQTLEVIRRRLASTTASNDDDIAMVSHELSIDLADPFTSGIFKIPVRGRDCTHLECFDLETWLNSRLGKKKTCTCGKGSSSCQSCPNEPSFVDKWKCPLCSGDARPYSLRIDEWLAGVRDKLEEDGALRIKSIVVSADGTWKIKKAVEADEGRRDDETSLPRAAMKCGGSQFIAVGVRETSKSVIELDSD
ncbi:uncharacterized protein B0I36DRAFT_256359 [Microdochium trichocladiopsis]|uniref:SP-RING-type domain-containing protein n=1 Tax=Microdochium trichocladiopsis TaxID=1682393 RepID=A0A9P8XSU5_9PEZI|nr:uncharacterized protein B0I36DRAFT_256359 [Microdochium trichocladiopsis]KAH7012446.1 hypothetical protein B0I36DRAFT_256359 [Microdochium trichocladiopsis]